MNILSLQISKNKADIDNNNNNNNNNKKKKKKERKKSNKDESEMAWLDNEDERRHIVAGRQ